MMVLVCGREHLGLVDVVDAHGLEHLCLNEVADTALGHHGDADGFENHLNAGWVGHAGHATGGADVRRDSLQCHHRDGACFFRYRRLLGGHHIHDDAALEHLGQARLNLEGTCSQSSPF